MKITVLAILLMMPAYFLVLYGAVGFIQDKRFFGSAPKENLAAIPDKKERFRGAHLIGWLKQLLFCCLLVRRFSLYGTVSETVSIFGIILCSFLSCCIVWKSMISFSLTGYCCATRTSFRIFIRN